MFKKQRDGSLKLFPFILFGIFLLLAFVLSYFQPSLAFTMRPASNPTTTIPAKHPDNGSRASLPTITASAKTGIATHSVLPTATSGLPQTPPRPTPRPASTAAVPTPPPSKNLVMYNHGVSNLFIDYTFSFISRNTCDHSRYLSPPCSYAIQYDGYGGLDFFLQSGSIAANDYARLEWNMYLNKLPITDFTALALDLHGNVIQETSLSQANITGSPAQGWVHISVSIAQLDPGKLLYHDIQIKNGLESSLSSTVYVDNVQLVSP